MANLYSSEPTVNVPLTKVELAFIRDLMQWIRIYDVSRIPVNSHVSAKVEDALREFTVTGGDKHVQALNSIKVNKEYLDKQDALNILRSRLHEVRREGESWAANDTLSSAVFYLDKGNLPLRERSNSIMCLFGAMITRDHLHLYLNGLDAEEREPHNV